MSRTAAYLAALASSAVSGLDPEVVRAATERPGNRFDTAFVTDTQRRTWVVRVPTTPAGGAQLDMAVDLLALLTRRLPFGVPTARGFVAVPEGRAAVYPYLHGRSVALAEVVPGPGIAAEIGRTLAALHNVEREVFDEAEVPIYDAETCRSRHLADLDRAAATGHVPTALLSRWESALEDVSTWRFAPTPVHGDLRGSRILVTFADDEDATTASVRAITGWERAKVADPADDFAVLVRECPPDAYDSVLEAYSVARIERPDRHLRLRARLASELLLLTQLLDAVTAAEPQLVSHWAAQLRSLEEHTAGEADLVPGGQPAPPASSGATIAAGASPAVTPAQSAESHTSAEFAEPAPTTDEKHTQPLKTGAAADPTTVISEEELAQARATTPQPNTTWYQVVRAAPAKDETSGSETPAAGDESKSVETDQAPKSADVEATNRE